MSKTPDGELMAERDENLSYERIAAAMDTLTAAFGVDAFPGAIGADDPRGVFIEAKRNLAALTKFLYGQDAWERILDRDNG